MNLKFNLFKSAKKLIAVIMIAAMLTAAAGCTLYRFNGIGTPNTDNKNTSGKPAFTITKLSENPDLVQMTKEEVAEQILKSTVTVLSYSAENAATHSGSGSGVVFDDEGYLITNAHVVTQEQVVKGTATAVAMPKVSIVFDKNGELIDYAAEITGFDTQSDLAVVKFTPDDRAEIVAAQFGDSSELKHANTVIAAGSPGGLEFTNSITVGYVSGLNRQIPTSSGYTIDCIQTDAAINPGNSGGPLVNLYGHVVGINSSKIAAANYDSMGFAIAINEETRVIITELKDNGKYSRGMMGITYNSQFITTETAKTNNWTYKDNFISGIELISVTDAMKSKGIQGKEDKKTETNPVGDIMIEIDGKPITSVSVISQVLRFKKPGDTVDIVVFKTSDSGGLLTSKTPSLTVTLK